MKQITFIILLLIASIITKAQTISTDANVLSTAEKEAIKNTVRMEGNKLIAQPGYTFKKGDNNTILLVSGNGVIKGKYMCGCKNNSGSCERKEATSGTDTTLECKSVGSNPCTDCSMFIVIKSGYKVSVRAIFTP